MKQFNPIEFRDTRKAKGYSQQELADLLGIAKTTIHQYETGVYNPRDNNLRKLQALFDLPDNDSTKAPNDFSPETMWKIRTDAGVSIQELAGLSKFSVKFLSSVEAGEYVPSYDTWKRIKAAVKRSGEIQSDDCEDLQPQKDEKTHQNPSFSFVKGKCYTIFKNATWGSRGTALGLGTDMDKACIFRYIGKQGLHHCFREVRGGWSRTYTDAQLVGKKIKEIDYD